MRHHALILVDRGVPHVHRFQASCSCGGWSAIPLRLKRSAIREFHRHQNRTTRFYGTYRTPTPVSDLPAELREVAL